MLTSAYLTTNPSAECPRADHARFDQYIKLLTILSKGDIVFRGRSPLCLPLPGKVIKLSFSASSKVLSPRFDSALMYREAERSASELKVLDFA